MKHPQCAKNLDKLSLNWKAAVQFVTSSIARDNILTTLQTFKLKSRVTFPHVIIYFVTMKKNFNNRIDPSVS